MEPIFNEEERQQRFAQQGYVLLPGLLHADDITHLTALFAEFGTEYAQPFHTSHFSTDEGYKRKVHEAVSEVVFAKAEPYLHRFRPIFGNFMVKKADPENFLQMHADWAYVDESRFRSVSIWIPLVDVDAKNGCLGIIEGSHKIMNSIRGPGIQQNNFVHDREWVKRYGTLLPMKAGDAIVYDHALLHFSAANTSPHIRPALNLSLVPEAADVIHYCIPEGENEIEKYSVPDNDFFIRYQNFQRPQTGTRTDTLPKSVITFIDAKMERYNRPKSIWQTLLRPFRKA